MTGNLTVPSLIGTNAIVSNVIAKSTNGNILVKTNGGSSIARFNNDLSTNFFGSIDVTTSASYGVTANRALKAADIPNFTLVESDASNQTWQINSTSALFTVRDVSRQADRFTIDTSGNADFAGHISLPDSKYLRLGADNDFIIYHDGATNYIQTVKQDSDLIIRVMTAALTSTP